MNRKVGVIFSYVLMFVEICSTMLFTPFLIRTLGQAEYGIYHLILSILSYFTLLDLGEWTCDTGWPSQNIPFPRLWSLVRAEPD